MNNLSASGFFAVWALIIAGLVGLTRSQTTRPLVYYALWLAIVLNVVVHSEEIFTLLSEAGLAGNEPATIPPSSTHGSGAKL